MRGALTLQTPIRVPDGAGGSTMSWQSRGVIHACLEAMTGRERVEGAVGVSRVPYRITIPAAPPGAPSRPGPRDRFLHGNRVFDIITVSEADDTARFLECRAIEEVTV